MNLTFTNSGTGCHRVTGQPDYHHRQNVFSHVGRVFGGNPEVIELGRKAYCQRRNLHMTLMRQQDSCVSVRSVFEVERRLSAPLYQRRFSWDSKNLDEFWEDIKLVEEGESEALFLGAIILKHEVASNPSTGTLEEFLVLDGQQRITTLFFALLAVALEWQEHGHPDDATDVAEAFLMSTRTTTRGTPRFFPTIPDTPEFISLCRKLDVNWNLPSGANFRQGRMSAALERAQAEVRARCVGEDGFNRESLKALELTIVDTVEIAAINIAERHHPNEVFNRLNRPGQPLTVGDLVKNEIFRRLAADVTTAMRLYHEHWDPFERSFANRQQLDNYYYPFTLTVNDRATVAKAFRVLNDHWDKEFRGIDDSAKTAELIIKDLGQFVPDYNALSAGVSYTATPEVATWVERLARMPAPRVTYAFLVQLLRAQRLGELRVSDAAECLRIVESFLVRRAFSGREPTGLHAVFKSLWGKNGGNPATLVSDLQTRTIDFPDDAQLRRDITSKPFYGRRLDGYVLSELEIAAHNTNPFSPEHLKAVTVDHLAPQSLKGAWANEFPDDREERDRILGLLGNLVPLSQSDNSTKGSADWDVARSRLRNETIYRTAREVLEQNETWGPQQIADRTASLAEQAISRWHRPE